MTENKNATMYLNSLLKKDTEAAKELKVAINQLKMFNFDALCHIANLSYSFRLPEEVAFLAVNLAIEQYKHEDKINIQILFQSLTRNQKQNFAIVFPLYEKAMEKYKNTKKEEKNNEYITNLPQKIKLEKIKKDTEYITADSDKYMVINPMRVPKQGYILNVYAKDFKDYCNIIQSTIKEFKDKNITLFLQKPETFQDNIKNKQPSIAYTILINDNFTFLGLSDETIKKLDEEIVTEIKNERKIAGRITVSMKLFGAKKFLLENGCLTEDNTVFLFPNLEDNDVFQYLEDIGKNENIIKYYIEIMSGISMTKYKQFYKSVIFDTENMADVLKIIEKNDPFNLDFIVDSNIDNKKILFIHKEHLRTTIKEMLYEKCNIEVNPPFDEYKI